MSREYEHFSSYMDRESRQWFKDNGEDIEHMSQAVRNARNMDDLSNVVERLQRLIAKLELFLSGREIDYE